jgi:hypothetical protein
MMCRLHRLVRTDKDLEGVTDSGEGLKAALASGGLCFSKQSPTTSDTGRLVHRVVWRNLREVCVRKSKVRVTPRT